MLPPEQATAMRMVMVGHGSILVYEKGDRSGRIRASEIVKVGRALVFARRASRRSSRLPAKANACSRTFGKKACVGVDTLGEPHLTTIPAPPHSWPRLWHKRCAAPRHNVRHRHPIKCAGQCCSPRALGEPNCGRLDGIAESAVGADVGHARHPAAMRRLNERGQRPRIQLARQIQGCLRGCEACRIFAARAPRGERMDHERRSGL
jgi:hypothetical protein